MSRIGQFLARQYESDSTSTEVWYDHLNPLDSNIHKTVKGSLAPKNGFISPK